MPPKPQPKLSPAALKKAYIEDLAAAWEFSRDKHRKETPYGFVLWGVEDPIRLHPVVLTEESLDRVAGRYVKDGWHDTLDEARKALRWSVADSPREMELNKKFPTVDALVSPHADALLTGGTYAPLAKAAMAALKQLDSRGIFGKGKGRERLVLGIITFDTEEDWSLKSAKQLNPASVYRRFREETTFKTKGHPARCTSLAVSRDGRSLYGVVNREKRSGPRESLVIACDVKDMNLSRRWEFSFPVYSFLAGPVACAADDSFVLGLGQKDSANYDTVLVRLPRDSNVPRDQYGIENAGTFALSPDGDRIAVWCENKIELFDGAMRKIHARAMDASVFRMLLLRSGDLLLATHEALVRLDPLSDATPNSVAIPTFRLSTDDAEQTVAVSRLERDDVECGIHILRLPSLDSIRVIGIPGHQAETPALSPDGRLLAFEAHDLTKPLGNPKRCSIVVFETANGAEVARRNPHRESIKALAFLRDNKTLAIGTYDPFAKSDPIELWRVPET
jgi:hypothetical protein